MFGEWIGSRDYLTTTRLICRAHAMGMDAAQDRSLATVVFSEVPWGPLII